MPKTANSGTAHVGTAASAVQRAQRALSFLPTLAQDAISPAENLSIINGPNRKDFPVWSGHSCSLPSWCCKQAGRSAAPH